ncbi:hypothetical protein DFH09DRAFT_1284321 [Mycena vulgaris]|nr:hypothetical protein DFH09DRAFT_1284321 [Mycena vulgaris]
MGIFLMCPNNCSDPEDIRRYIKEFRLGTERVQGSSPVQFPRKLTFDNDTEFRSFNTGVATSLLTWVHSMPTAADTSDAESDSAGTVTSTTAVRADSRDSFSREELRDSLSPLSPTSADEFPFAFQTPGLHHAPPTFSRDLTEPGVLSLTPTWSLVDPWIGLENVLGDPLLKLLYRSVLGPGIPFRTLTSDDIEKDVFLRHVTYRLRPTYVEQLYDSLERLSAVVHCAGNKHYPRYQGGGLHVPMCLPMSALDEAGSTMPGISLFRGYGMRRINESPSFATEQQAIDFAATGQKIWVYYMHWLTCSVLSSLEHGYNSRWSYGAPINMADEEFLHRISKTASYGSGQSLRRLMSHAVYSNSMDFLCAQFVSKYARRLLVSERHGDVYLTMWPVPAETATVQEGADQFLRMYLYEQGLTLEDLDDEVLRIQEPESSMYEIKCL